MTFFYKCEDAIFFSLNKGITTDLVWLKEVQLKTGVVPSQAVEIRSFRRAA
jgi:hypothetical protein